MKGISLTEIKTLMIEQTVFTDPIDIIKQIGLNFCANSSNSYFNPDFLKYKQSQEMIISPTSFT